MSPPVEIDKNVPGSWNDLPNNSGRAKTWIVEWNLQPLHGHAPIADPERPFEFNLVSNPSREFVCF